MSYATPGNRRSTRSPNGIAPAPRGTAAGAAAIVRPRPSPASRSGGSAGRSGGDTSPRSGERRDATLRSARDSPGVVVPERRPAAIASRITAGSASPGRARVHGRGSAHAGHDRGPTTCQRPRRLSARCRSRQQTGIGGPHRPVTGRSRRKPVAEPPWDPPHTPHSRRRRDDRVGGHDPRSPRTHRLPGPPQRTSERRPYPAPARHPARRQHRTHLPTRSQRPAQTHHRPALLEGQGLAPNPTRGRCLLGSRDGHSPWNRSVGRTGVGAGTGGSAARWVPAPTRPKQMQARGSAFGRAPGDSVPWRVSGRSPDFPSAPAVTTLRDGACGG